MANSSPTTPSSRRARTWWAPLADERLERKLALSFGFMSFIPTLILVWAMVYHVDLGLAIYPITASSFIGYFLVVRRMVRSVLSVAERVKRISAGQSEPVQVDGQDEIGQIAKAFNRVTHNLEQKIEELESSRELIKRLLVRTSGAIVSYEGIDQILALIVENAGIALEAQVASLLLVDETTQRLSPKALWSDTGQAVSIASGIGVGEGIAGWIVKEGRPLRGSGSVTELGCGGIPEGSQHMIIGVPLRLRERALGVLMIWRHDASRAFTEDDEILLSNIGSQMAVVIENDRLNVDMERTYVETVLALVLAVEAKDPYSAGHSKRVGFYASKIAEAMGLGSETARILHDAGTLHDVGKIGIKDEILLKRVPLTEDEAKAMQQHAFIGEAIVKPVRSLQKVVPLVRHHHERFDGSGYPAGLKGEAIPLGARILSVADTYDAMVTDRPYRKRLTLEEATRQLRQGAGRQFDPLIVDAFLRVLSEKAQRLEEATHPPASGDSPLQR